ncbi:hypothetical protein EYM_07025 [Ignicoccus islandicus DSM 13165]|uniref:CDP-archaeol synthase n=1 Tax=Ignicoccus islandicus DSM 13165 TaxID=940295 RepID=A0A0U3E248_9CREN|nr:CDP-2,3-bis-(O-geranylgeranyl)-sn-glycerol synthase [Ignicoccus islandicus]ALU11995.1 hypothetical protein EYM_07025 [Ignicoccus islandicus DSM 13165]
MGELLDELLQIALMYLPAMVSNASPVFLKRGTPIDFGRNFVDGKRILGDGKTWEGFLLGMWFGITVATSLWVGTEDFRYFLYGSMGSLGALLGDMFFSFIKRRIGLPRGAPFPLGDQLDFFLGATALMVASGWRPQAFPWLVMAFVIVMLHVMTNRIAYWLGLKDVPW